MESIKELQRYKGISEKSAIEWDNFNAFKAMEHFGFTDYPSWDRYIKESRANFRKEPLILPDAILSSISSKRMAKVIYQMLRALSDRQGAISVYNARLLELEKENEILRYKLNESLNKTTRVSGNTEAEQTDIPVIKTWGKTCLFSHDI